MTQIISPSSAQWSELATPAPAFLPEKAWLMVNGDGTYSFTLDVTNAAGFQPASGGGVVIATAPDASAASITLLANRATLTYTPI